MASIASNEPYDQTERNATAMRVLIVGGYGTFGGRLAELLGDAAGVTLLIAGRSQSAAETFCATARNGAAAAFQPTAFDRAGELDRQLTALAPDIVVDASGPFQGYDGDPYALPRACLRAGADYIDLADAAAFVAGIHVLDADAKRAGRALLSGASSFPVLTAAVVRHLAVGFDHVDSIQAGIAPSPFAGVGLNVIRAIASYAGKPVHVTADGKRVGKPGFVDSRRMTVAVPGTAPLPSIRFGLTEVPDLDVLARDWPAAREIWTGAGPTPALLHRLLWAAGYLVHWRVLPSLLPLAPVMHRVINTVRWGEHRGGMIVEINGRVGGVPVTRSWHLLADGESGPYIPSMAAEALVRRRLAGRSLSPGARSAHRDLELTDYDAMFATRGIRTGIRSTPAANERETPYESVLGSVYSVLPAPIREVHSFQVRIDLSGRATVTGASNPLTRAIARLFGFPAAAADVPVTVELSRTNGLETWRRTFAGHPFVSTQETGTDRRQHHIIERFGPLAFDLALTADDHRLGLTLRRWRAFGIPMPRTWAPTTTAYEHAADERFNFSVDLGLPLLGRLVKYEGWLIPTPPINA